jgi:NAD(P)-dependent dehydrogenase (short-subunit alcohol dehydrogenase family)
VLAVRQWLVTTISQAYRLDRGRPHVTRLRTLATANQSKDVDWFSSAPTAQFPGGAKARMQARGRGSILFSGGGLALHPFPAPPTLSVGKGALRALALMLAEELAPAGVRVGTVTIMGTVAPGTNFDPDAIAQGFLTLHRGTPDPRAAKLRFPGTT